MIQELDPMRRRIIDCLLIDVDPKGLWRFRLWAMGRTCELKMVPDDEQLKREKNREEIVQVAARKFQLALRERYPAITPADIQPQPKGT